MRFRFPIPLPLAAALLLAGGGCARHSTMEPPPTAQEALRQLNTWDKSETSLALHGPDNEGRIASGETTAWIESHQRTLRDLGYEAVWNEQKKRFTLRKR